MNYFFDSYALMEVLFGNKEYAERTTGAGMVTSSANLLEVHYHLTVRRGKHDADLAYATFKEAIAEIEEDDVKNASVFRAANRKKNLSFIDCLGYAMAKRRGMRFLTGDKAFKGMENVEFVV